MRTKFTEEEFGQYLDMWAIENDEIKIADELKGIVRDWFKYIHTVNFEKPYAVKELTRVTKEEQQKPRVKRKDIYNFRMNLFTISMEFEEYMGLDADIDEDNTTEIEERELSYIAKWLKEIGVEVME